MSHAYSIFGLLYTFRPLLLFGWGKTRHTEMTCIINNACLYVTFKFGVGGGSCAYVDGDVIDYLIFANCPILVFRTNIINDKERYHF